MKVPNVPGAFLAVGCSLDRLTWWGGRAYGSSLIQNSPTNGTAEMRSIRIMPHALALGFAALVVFMGCATKPPEDLATDAGSQPAPRNVAEISETADAVNESGRSTNQSNSHIQPEDLVYRGAFRLPDESNGSNWEYSGYAMTYCPVGDPGGPEDGYPGSLFAVGHDHHQQVSKIAIPVPVISRNKEAADLNTAETLQEFRDIRGGFYRELEIPRAGLEYLPPQGEQGTQCFFALRPRRSLLRHQLRNIA